MIEFERLSVSLPPASKSPTRVLHNIHATIADGDWVALTGRNGSGKTTLLLVIAGIVPPSSGACRTSRSAGGKPSIALLVQEPDNQFVASTVRAELLLSVPPDRDDATASARAREAAEVFALGNVLTRNPHELSGGEKQRLAFATVWLAEPDILLLDEPTSYLDTAGRERVARFVGDMHATGVTVVWATPATRDAGEAQSVLCLDAGEITYRGPAGAETGGPPPRKRVGTGTRATLDGGQTTAAANAGDSETRGVSVVDARAIGFSYERHRVLRDLTCVIEAGECVGIAGANGAGKSTLLGIMSGVLRPTEGTLHLRYAKPTGDGGQNVFYLFQSPERMFFAETAYEEIAYGLKNLKTPRSEIGRRVEEALGAVGLDPARFAARLPFTLSLGEMRRLAFAAVIALKPRFVLLDEPTSCLDDDGLAILDDVMTELRRGGSTIVVASHDAAVMDRCVDRVIELSGPPDG